MTPTEEMVRVAARALAPELWADHDNMTPTERAVWEAGLTAKKFIAEEKAKVALTAALAAMWQPIDGEARRAGRILATGGGLGSNVEVVSYNEKIGCWDAETCTLDDRDNEADGYNRPTHYMPLPAPSQLSKRGDAEKTAESGHSPSTTERE